MIWTVQDVDLGRWVIERGTVRRAGTSVRRTSVQAPGRHGVIPAGPVEYDEPTLALILGCSGADEDEVEQAVADLHGALSGPGSLTVTRTVAGAATTADARLVSIAPEDVSPHYCRVTVLLALPQVFWRGESTTSTPVTIPADGATAALAAGTAPVTDAVVRVSGPCSSVDLRDVASGTGMTWTGPVVAGGEALFLDAAALRAWVASEPDAWSAQDPASRVRTNLATNPSFESQASTTVEVARNLIPNPSYEVSVTGVSKGSAIESVISASGANGAAAGSRSLVITGAAEPGASLTTFVGQSVVASPRQWLAFACRVRRHAPTQLHGRLVMVPRAGTTSLSTLRPTAGMVQLPITANLSPANTLTFAAQMPELTDGALVGIEFGSSPTDVTAPPSFVADTDAWIAAVADTEAAALALVAEYHDGDTSPDPDLIASWTGIAHASESVLTGRLPARQGEPAAAASAAGGARAHTTRTWASSGSRSVRVQPGPSATTLTALYVAGAAGSMSRLGMTPGGTYAVAAVCRLDRPQVGPTDLVARSIVLSLVREETVAWVAASATAPNTAGAHLVAFAFTLPEDVSDVYLRLMCGSANPADQVWWDDLILCEGASAGAALHDAMTYFDGARPSSRLTTYAWTGSPHASTSTETTVSHVDASVGIDYPPAGPLQLWPTIALGDPTTRTHRVLADASGAGPSTAVAVRARPAYL